MDTTRLQEFDLRFPGIWIEGKDRDWAFNVQHILGLVEGLFVEAVASYGLFQPITFENMRKLRETQRSRYEECLNVLYAKAFVFALHGIEKLLQHLCDKSMHPPSEIQKLYDDYKNSFGQLKHIRDSAIHIEDRGRGVNRKQEPIPTHILVIGGFIDNCFTFSGEDGKQYGIEISEATLKTAKGIIQRVIESYQWSNIGVPILEETKK